MLSSRFPLIFDAIAESTLDESFSDLPAKKVARLLFIDMILSSTSFIDCCHLLNKSSLDLVRDLIVDALSREASASNSLHSFLSKARVLALLHVGFFNASIISSIHFMTGDWSIFHTPLAFVSSAHSISLVFLLASRAVHTSLIFRSGLASLILNAPLAHFCSSLSAIVFVHFDGDSFCASFQNLSSIFFKVCLPVGVFSIFQTLSTNGHAIAQAAIPVAHSSHSDTV